MLIAIGRPRATATDRSRVKSVHQMRFQSRLSALLSCEPSMLLFVRSPETQRFESNTYLLCMPEP